MIDRTILGLSRAKLEFRRLADRLEGDPEALLFVSFSGDTEDEVRDKLDQLERAWRRATGTATTSCAPRPRPSRTR